MAEIRHSIAIQAPAERIVPLVASPGGLAAWWAEDVTPMPGSDAVELGFYDRSTVYRLRPAGDAPDVRWICESGQEWAGTEIVFRLRRAGDLTRLEFSHEHWADASPYFVACNAVWGHLMFRLKSAAERGGSPRPLFTTSGMAGD